MNTLASRTLHLFENKSDSSGLVMKDHVGINLIYSLILYNITYSAINVKRTESDQDDSSNPSQQVLSTSSLFEELSSLMTLIELDFGDIYKSAYGKFHPQKFKVSQIVLAFLFQI